MVYVLILGRFQVLIDQNPVPELEGRKIQELLAYLSLNQNRTHAREKLSTLLWPEQVESHGRRYLRKTLWQLQSGLGQESSQMLDVEQECICLNQSATLWVDAVCLDEAFTAVKNIPGEDLNETQAEMLRDVSQLYRGDLLENWYLDWCLIERQRIQHIYLTLNDKLMRYCTVHGQYDSGLQYGYRILNFDNAREHTHRELMKLYYLSGDRTGAIRQYQQCVEILAHELEVTPTEQTQQLYEQICRGSRLNGTPAIPTPLQTPLQTHLDQPDVPSAQMISSLQEDIAALQTILARFQNHLRKFTEL